MRAFIKKFAVFFLFAGFFSFVINMLLLTPSLYMLQTYDRVLGSRSLETLYMLTLMLGIFLLVMSALEMVRSRLLVKANNAIDAMLAPYLLQKMIEGATVPEGNRYANGLRDLNTIKGFLGGQGIFALFDAPWLPLYLIILYMMAPLLFVVALAGSLLMLLLTVMTEYSTRTPLKEANLLGRKAAEYVTSALRNAEVINAMGMLKDLAQRWAAFNERTLSLQSSASNRAGAITGMTKFVRQFLQSLMLGAGAYLVLQNKGFTPGLMIAGTIILGKALSPIEHVIASWKLLIEARTAYSRLDEFIKTQSLDLPHMELPAPTGQLSLEHASFGIRSQNKTILKDITFALSPGEALGIIGPSASGKSSLARLITGIWKPQLGTVRLDGVDISTWPKDHLGQYLGYLPQDVELFAGTIADNIARLGVPDTERVIEAAKMADVHDMVLRMPNGYDTQIGEAGAVLSGGQRQRIGLARALFRKPRLVVLDEPNASLDAEGELALARAIQQIKQDRVTTVVITHKMSLLSVVDKLLVMQDGVMALFGPRDAVLAHLAEQQRKQQAQQQQQQTPQHQAVAPLQPSASSTQGGDQ